MNEPEVKYRSGDMVRFDFSIDRLAYGVIVYVAGDIAKIDYKNPISGEYSIADKNVSELVKIGSQIK